MFIRKFYEPAIAETAGAATEIVEKVESAAAMMAKMGTKSDENSAIRPTSIVEKKEEVKTEEATPAATAKVEEPVKTESSEPIKTKVEEPAKVETPIAQTPAKVPTLDEVLKNNQPDTVLKALGFDDQKADFVSKLKDADPKLVGIMQAYENGTLGDYVRELATDYKTMSAEDVMRHQLRVDYPKASAAALEALYEEEIVEKYKTDPEVYSATEVERGKLLLEAKADRYRDGFVANQEKFLMPKTPEPKAIVENPDNREQVEKQNIESYRKEISEMPYAKEIIANKMFTVGKGETKFGFPVEPNDLFDVLTNSKIWVATMYDKQTGSDGKEYNVPKTEHQMLVATVSKYGQAYIDALITHYEGIGSKKVMEPIDNAKKPDNSTSAKSEVLPPSVAAAMAQKGRRNNG